MRPALSIVLPYRNVESTLARQVAELLDAASDLCDRFEVVLVDDGATDGDNEVARDLVRRYPQVRLAPRTSSAESAAARGLAATRGQHIVLHAAEGLPGPNDVRSVPRGPDAAPARSGSLRSVLHSLRGAGRT